MAEGMITTSDAAGRPLASWTLMTSHGLVLLFLSISPDATIREVASALDLTERRVADIIRDLTGVGLVLVRRVGRRNHYVLNPNAHFRHSLISEVPFREFVSLWRRFRKPGQERGRGVPVPQEADSLAAEQP